METTLSEYVKSELQQCEGRGDSSCHKQDPPYYSPKNASGQEWLYSVVIFSSTKADYYRTTYGSIDEETRSVLNASLSALTKMDDGEY